MSTSRTARRLAAAGFLAFAFAAPLAAYDGPVEKLTFTLPSYTTVGGKTLPNVRVG